MYGAWQPLQKFRNYSSHFSWVPVEQAVWRQTHLKFIKGHDVNTEAKHPPRRFHTGYTAI